MEKVYKIITADNEVFWTDTKEDILNGFGTCVEITEYDLMNPVDITDEVNNEYS